LLTTEPEGWVLVPREPTREMWAAMGDALVGYRQRHHDAVAAALWNAVLAAAPPAPAEAAASEGMRKALVLAANQFRFYVDEHRKKGAPEAEARALINAFMAERCEIVLAAVPSPTEPAGRHGDS
jgi:hypothetical protein